MGGSIRNVADRRARGEKDAGRAVRQFIDGICLLALLGQLKAKTRTNSPEACHP